MTKKQKIWLYVFLALFVIPEVLWSPVGNFYYELSQTSKSGGTEPFRDNFLQNSDNLSILKVVLLIQFIGFTLFLYMFWKHRGLISNPYLRYLLVLLFLAIFILSAFSAYFAFTFSPDIL